MWEATIAAIGQPRLVLTLAASLGRALAPCRFRLNFGSGIDSAVWLLDRLVAEQDVAAEQVGVGAAVHLHFERLKS
jgi:hypothetical protein